MCVGIEWLLEFCGGGWYVLGLLGWLIRNIVLLMEFMIVMVGLIGFWRNGSKDLMNELVLGKILFFDVLFLRVFCVCWVSNLILR